MWRRDFVLWQKVNLRSFFLQEGRQAMKFCVHPKATRLNINQVKGNCDFGFPSRWSKPQRFMNRQDPVSASDGVHSLCPAPCKRTYWNRFLFLSCSSE